MNKNISRMLIRFLAVVCAVVMALSMLPLQAYADEPEAETEEIGAEPSANITFWKEQEFTGASETVDLYKVNEGEALPAFSSGYKNWEIRTDGGMELVYATRPGQKWTKDMIDALKAASEKGYGLNALPAYFNITEANTSVNAASAQAAGGKTKVISPYIIRFVFDSDLKNTDFAILELDIRSIKAGDPLPALRSGKNAWSLQSAAGDGIAKATNGKWTEEVLNSVLAAANDGKTVIAYDIADTGEFPDVSDTSKSYYKPVYWAVEQGIVAGYKNGLFGPADNTTRAQFAVMLWRMNGRPAAGSGAKTFPDVTSSMSSYKSIRWAASEGIVQGYKDGRYGPSDYLTRRQIVVMIWRYLGKPDPSAKTSFKDVKSSDSAARAIAWANENDVIRGYSDGTFRPDNNCTRSQIVTILYRAVRAGLMSVKK